MTANNLFKDGLTWSMAQYLEPLPITQFLLTASDYQSVENLRCIKTPIGRRLQTDLLKNKNLKNCLL